MEGIGRTETVPSAAGASAAGHLVYPDVLRLLSLFLVMQTHVMSHAAAGLPPRVGFDATVCEVYDLFARFAAIQPLFMISGALFLDMSKSISWKKFYSKNLLRLVTAFIFWSAVYALAPENVFAHLPATLTLRTFVARFVQGPYHFWFLWALIGMYLITPFLRAIVASRRRCEYFLALWLLFGLLAPSLNALGLLNESINMSLGHLENGFMLGLPGYYVLGHYLASYEWRRSWRIVLYALGAACALALIAVQLCTDLNLATGPLTLYCALPAAACFVAVKRIFRNTPADGGFAGALRGVSALGFGAYLVHPLCIWLVTVLVGFSIDSFPLIVSIPVVTLAVYAVSFLISWLLGKIPFFRRYFV